MTKLKLIECLNIQHLKFYFDSDKEFLKELDLVDKFVKDCLNQRNHHNLYWVQFDNFYIEIWIDNGNYWIIDTSNVQLYVSKYVLPSEFYKNLKYGNRNT